MLDKKISVTMATLQSHNHIVGDIERGVTIYNRGGVEFEEQEPNHFWAQVSHKGDETKSVTVTFTHDGQDIEHHFCHCSWRHGKNPPICRHVVAAVLAIQGGISESKLELEKSFWLEHFVADKDTAEAVGSGTLEVLATPVMITLMERAACTLLAGMLEEGQTSVGTSINVSHTVATPVGLTIETEAKIVSVQGRVITFAVSASDEAGEIGKGSHTRVIVDADQFIQKAKRRSQS